MSRPFALYDLRVTIERIEGRGLAGAPERGIRILGAQVLPALGAWRG
jgi:hypothetical protein